MRARFINEAIGFKRHGNVSKTLGLGIIARIDNYFQEVIKEQSYYHGAPFITIHNFNNNIKDDPTFQKLYNLSPIIVNEKIFDLFSKSLENIYNFVNSSNFFDPILMNSDIFKTIKWSKTAFPNDLSKVEEMFSIARKIWDKEIEKLIRKKQKNKAPSNKYPEIMEAEEYLRSQGLKIITTNAQNKNGSISVLHPAIPTEYVITGAFNVLRYPFRTLENRPSKVFETAHGNYMAKSMELVKRLNILAKKYTEMK